MMTKEQIAILEALSRVTKTSADIQGRVLRWAIVSDEDKDYFRQDIENLRDDVASILLMF